MALAELVDHVIGVDPDRDRITVAVVCARTQGEVATRAFATTARGYGRALRWAKDHTTEGRRVWSIESSGSYGAGLAATLAAKGEFVIEFDHSGARPLKDGAKSDSLGIVRAAREILGRKAWATPRSRGAREGLRTLITARGSAKLARGAAINVLKAPVVTAPVDLREEMRGRPLMDLVSGCQRLRPDTATDPEYAATKLSLRSIATRVRQLTDECHELELAMKLPLSGSVASHPGRPTPDRPRHATDSHAAVTGNSTGHCTQSSWRAPSTTSGPRTTSPAGSPRARPRARRCAASSATAPATSSGSSKRHPRPLDTDRSLSMAALSPAAQTRPIDPTMEKRATARTGFLLRNRVPQSVSS